MTDRETARPAVREIESEDTVGRNRMWRTCRVLDLPYIVLLKNQEYACFHYDMFVIDRDLSSEAVEKIKEAFYRFIRANKGVFRWKNSYWIVGPTSGFIPDMKLSKARELAGEIAKIVRDPKNHRPLGGS